MIFHVPFQEKLFSFNKIIQRRSRKWEIKNENENTNKGRAYPHLKEN
jgi:hypothetical protein